jgi:hypothetical protein
MNKPFKLMHKLLNLSASELVLLLKGYLLCLVFKIMVLILPLKFYFNLLTLKPAIRIPEEMIFPRVNMVVRNMKRIERYSLLSFSCLVRSLAVKTMLLSLGVESQIQLGIYKTHQGELLAHASVWLDGKAVYLKNNAFNPLISL